MTRRGVYNKPTDAANDYDAALIDRALVMAIEYRLREPSAWDCPEAVDGEIPWR